MSNVQNVVQVGPSSPNAKSCTRQSLMNPFRPKNSSVTYPLKVSTMSDVEQFTESSSGMLGEQVTKALSRVLEATKQPSEKMLKISSVTLEALEQPSKHVPKFSTTASDCQRAPQWCNASNCQRTPQWRNAWARIGTVQRKESRVLPEARAPQKPCKANGALRP